MGLEDIRAVILDVDGVLTDGSMFVADDGHELKRFHTWDGAGIRFLLEAGIQVAFLSARHSQAVAERAKQLGILNLRQNAKDKLPGFEELLEDLELDAAAVCYVGDDFTDIPVLRRAGLAATVAGARPEVQALADLVTHAPGGQGAVRELAERILKAQDKWADVLARYEAPQDEAPQ